MWRVFGAATHTHTQVVTTCRSPIPTATVGFALQFPPAGGIDFRAKEVSCWILVLLPKDTSSICSLCSLTTSPSKKVLLRSFFLDLRSLDDFLRRLVLAVGALKKKTRSKNCCERVTFIWLGLH